MLAGSDLGANVPLQRWDAERHFRPAGGPGTAATRFGAFLAGVEAFDAAAFRLAGSEAAVLDPHARLLLEHTQVRCCPQ